MLEPYMILATHDGRGEQEVLVDPLQLGNADITVDGTTTRLWELEDDSTAPVAALADWRAAGARYQAQLDRLFQQKLAAARSAVR